MKYYRKKLALYPIFEWLEVGILLCFAGGFLDAYTYVTRGGVFCNAQTSNLIFLTLNLASGNASAALRYITPVLLFIAGVFFSELCLHLSRKKRDEFRGHGFVLLGEIAVLIVVGFLPPSVPDMFVNALVSLAAAVQFDNFRKMEGKPFATAFCTGNMRTATEHAMHSVAEKDVKAIKVTGKYFLIIFSFLCGVLAGYYASQAAGGFAAFIPAAVLFVVLVSILTGNLLQKKLSAPQTSDAAPSEPAPLPAETASPETVPAETVPPEAMPVEALPDEIAPADTFPKDTLSGETASGEPLRTESSDAHPAQNSTDKEKQS